MENILEGDRFYYDLGDLLSDHDLEDKEDIEKLDDDYCITVDNTKLEPIFKLDMQFVIDAIVQRTERFDERFPEESDSTFKKIEDAIRQSVDIDKLNSLIPELYYPDGETTKITKKDMLEYVS